MLQQHPVKTKGLTCGVCTVIGDFFTQDRLRTKFQSAVSDSQHNLNSSSHSFSRSIKLFLYGTILLGPSLHYWFRTLDKLLPSTIYHSQQSSRWLWSAKRVIVEQASYSLFVTSMYLLTMGSLDYVWNEETFANIQCPDQEYRKYNVSSENHQ